MLYCNKCKGMGNNCLELFYKFYQSYDLDIRKSHEKIMSNLKPCQSCETTGLAPIPLSEFYG